MLVEPIIYASEPLQKVLFDEYNELKEKSSFNQLAYITTLPGVRSVRGLPDIHNGYGFPIGSVSAFSLQDGIVSPGGVGFDINCGVRSYATNLHKDDIDQNKLADLLFERIPAGMGNSKTDFKLQDLNSMLDNGIEHLLKMNLINDDPFLIENLGKMEGNSRLVSQKAKGRCLQQLGSLGSGNHYLEIQFVDEIFDLEAASIMNITKKGQLIITIHTGSRGLGHQVCQDYLQKINKYKNNDFNDELAYINIQNEIGKDYLKAMGSAANFAFCNRALIGETVIKAIKELYKNAEIKLIYDVCHNIAKIEEHYIDNNLEKVLVHRKGASKAFPPFHSDVPEIYKKIGQPVFVGGSMGTSSFILTGGVESMQKSLGTACHGAGRIVPRSLSTKTFDYKEIMQDLKDRNIIIKCQSQKGIVEEAPGCYKNVDVVVDVCEQEKITKKIVKVKPFIVIKG
ncbi:hypothetical protein GVAV_000439 [Gurleya vavrai]